MPRRLELAASPEECQGIIDDFREHPGVVRMTRHRGASLRPEGDVLVIDATNDGAYKIATALRQSGRLKRGALTLDQPSGLVRADQTAAIDEESNEALWEEMGSLLRQETNISASYLVLMATAGIAAAIGVGLDRIHIVIGAMLVAPGFAPLLRVAFGFLGRRRDIWLGARSTLFGYAVLAAGGAAGTLVLLLSGEATVAQVTGTSLARFWTTTTFTGVVTSLLAGVAGGFIVSTRMKVLATGVMVLLALIPSMGLVGAGLAVGEISFAGKALLRWIVDVACVVLGGGGVMAVKRFTLHKGKSEDS